MLRRTVYRFTSIVDTSVPSNFTHATDLAFYFPRFQPRVHLRTHGIPELRDAVDFLQPSAAPAKRWSKPPELSPSEWAKQCDRAYALLERGEEIMESAGGLSTALTADVLRASYVTRFELLSGEAHLPRSPMARRCDVQRLVLKQSARLLYYNDNWDKTDVQQLDTAIVILAHFVRAFSALHERPFHAKQPQQTPSNVSEQSPMSHANISSSNRACPSTALWSMPIPGSDGGELTLSMVMDRLDELLHLSRVAAKAHATHCPDLRWNVPKLLILKGLLTIPLTGNLMHAQQYVNEAAQTVYEFLRRKQPVVDGLVPRKQEVELGLFMLAQAEIAARIFDWSVDVGEVSRSVLEMFESAAKFYSEPFNNALQADGIMSTENTHEREFEMDAYATCLLSYGTFLLNAPRPPGKSNRDCPVFLAKQIFTRSPIISVATSSDIIFADVQDLVPMKIDVTRKKAGEAFERALQVNRTLYPDHRLNSKAGWTLLAMACLYADMRDYLYATGLFASADKAIAENYGAISREQAFAAKLRYEFLAGVGSEQEAKTAQHEVVSVLAGIDRLNRG